MAGIERSSEGFRRDADVVDGSSSLSNLVYSGDPPSRENLDLVLVSGRRTICTVTCMGDFRASFREGFRVPWVTSKLAPGGASRTSAVARQRDQRSRRIRSSSTIPA
jgi:hypothetical protein